MADKHMSYPILEIYPKISDKLANDYPQYNHKLELILFIVKNTNMEISGTQLSEEFRFVEKILKEGEDLVISKYIQNNSNFKLKVALNLIERATIKLSQSPDDSEYQMIAQHCKFMVNQADIILATIPPTNFPSS